MFVGPAPARFTPDDVPPHGGDRMSIGISPGERDDSEACLVARARAAFPSLAMARTRIEDGGGDHRLLIVDDSFAIRFPRTGMHDLRFEIAVLEQLRLRSDVPVPAYTHVAPGGRFAGYGLIAGIALTPARFAKLAPPAKTEVLARIANFLSDLHTLPTSAIEWPHVWPRLWTPADFAERGLTERLPAIARFAPRLAGPIGGFYRRYRDDLPPRPAIVHGDLCADHLLLDKRAGTLAGIIDFGDVALGDPAHDFAGLWSYGAAAVMSAIGRYRTGTADPGLLERSRNHFIRRRIDRLHQRIVDGEIARATATAASITALLADRPPREGGEDGHAPERATALYAPTKENQNVVD